MSDLTLFPLKVYVAGPYTKGDVALNVRAAIEAADQILKAGHVPFCPHLTHFWHLVCPGPYQQWIDFDLQWLPACDALVRLPGESSGADAEVALASKLGIPVFQGPGPRGLERGPVGSFLLAASGQGPLEKLLRGRGTPRVTA